MMRSSFEVSEPFVVGVDFGTDSLRAVLVEASSGEEVASRVESYRRWSEGRYCEAGACRYRQHPSDYLEGFERAIRSLLKQVHGVNRERIAGIGVCATASTVAPLNRNGEPLVFTSGFEDDPDAMFILWKDHTALEEAELITRIAKVWDGPDYTGFSGDAYSSEWFWAKILHALRGNEKVRSSAFSWAELCDWFPSLLAGVTDPLVFKRSRCPAGHKALWHRSWGGLPPEDFFGCVDPLLANLRRRLYEETYTADTRAGGLSSEWAARLGLQPGVAVAVGTVDAHAGGVALNIREGTLVLILGTSADYLTVAPYHALDGRVIHGICGQVDGSILPGMIGLEAAQSAFGDLFRWFKELLLWSVEELEPLADDLPAEVAKKIRNLLDRDLLKTLEKASRRFRPPDENLTALDWLNGRNSPDVDERLKGAFAGLTLNTTIVDLYRSLIEAAAFGAKAIARRFGEEGIFFDKVVASGGIAKKSPFVMQVLCDVLETPIEVAATDFAGARGAAIFGAVAAGIYGSAQDAQAHMGSPVLKTYLPEEAAFQRYRRLFDAYEKLGQVLSAFR